MEKVKITVAFEDEKLEALEFCLKKERSSVRKQMDEALRQLYESKVPEPVREYLDSKAASTVRPKRPPRSSQPKPERTERPEPDRGEKQL